MVVKVDIWPSQLWHHRLISEKECSWASCCLSSKQKVPQHCA